MKTVTLGLTLLAVSAFAQDNTQGWSIVGGKTVGNQQTAVEAGFGFPGIHGSILRGVTDQLDIGGRLTFDYGLEGLTNQIVPGVKVQGLLHLRLAESGILSVRLDFEPGPLFAFYGGHTDVVAGGFRVVNPGYTAAGLALPVRLQLGLAASSALNVGVHFDLPMWVAFSNNVNSQAVLVFPVLAGVGIEYFVKHNFLVLFEIRMGPTLFSDGERPVFTLISNVGIGYRF